MIAELTLHNFKCFIDQSITVGPLTLLVGANASGKSSVLQSLLLLRQSHLRGALSEGKLVLNGRLSNVGTMRDAVSRDLVDEELIFDLGTNNGERNVFRFEYVRGETDVYVMSGPLPQYDKQLNIFQTAFNYLNAERIGPRLTYPMQEDERWSYDVGIHGEYTAQILNRAKNDPVTLTIDDPDTNTQIPELPLRSIKPIRCRFCSATAGRMICFVPPTSASG